MSIMQMFSHLVHPRLQKLTNGKLAVFSLSGEGVTNGLCLLPLWFVSLVRHGVARLQQQNFMQLQRESVNIRDSEETLQPFPLLV